MDYLLVACNFWFDRMASLGFNNLANYLIPEDVWGKVCFAYVDVLWIHGRHGMILLLEVGMKGQNASLIIKA
jgi:hypothetical protein